MNKPYAEEKEFVPRGAVVFFAGLVAFYGLVWLGLYALMLGRRAP
jgi:hypothetical protein